MDQLIPAKSSSRPSTGQPQSRQGGLHLCSSVSAAYISHSTAFKSGRGSCVCHIIDDLHICTKWPRRVSVVHCSHSDSGTMDYSILHDFSTWDSTMSTHYRNPWATDDMWEWMYRKGRYWLGAISFHPLLHKYNCYQRQQYSTLWNVQSKEYVKKSTHAHYGQNIHTCNSPDMSTQQYSVQ